MEKINKNIIAFIKRNIVLGEYNELNPDPVKLANLLGKCGLALHPNLKHRISSEYEDILIKDLSPYLQKIYDPDSTWISVYTNPTEVLRKSELELRLEQFIIYLDPEFINLTSSNNAEELKFWNTNNYNITEIISGISEEEFSNISCNILKSKIVPPEIDLKILDWFLDEGKKYLIIPDKIPVKELLCRVLSKIPETKIISSVTDILRVVTYMSYKDTTLDFPKTRKDRKNKRIKLTNQERKTVCKLLESYINPDNKIWCLQDAKKYYNVWMILEKTIHSGLEFFSELRNHKNSEWWSSTWGSKIRRAYDNNNLKEVILLYSMRPGEFIRHFDSLLRRIWESRDTENLNLLMEKFLDLDNITPKIILELHEYYNRRNNNIQRYYIDKKGIRHNYPSLNPLDEDTLILCRDLLIEKLKKIYSSRDSLENKKIFLNFDRGDIIPLQLRTSRGCSTKIILPGHKEPIDPNKIYRFFSQWNDLTGYEDLDMHSFLIDEKNNLECIGYNSRFNLDSSIIFSGDVRHRKGNCSEYITISPRELKKQGWKGVLVSVHNYEGRSLDSLENYIGMCEIDSWSITNFKDKEWNPNITTSLRSEVSCRSISLMGFYINLETMTVRFIQQGLTTELDCMSKESRLDLLKSFEINSDLDVYNLMKINIESRGGLVVSENFDEEIGKEFLNDYQKLIDTLL